jgi:hypothetical protein
MPLFYHNHNIRTHNLSLQSKSKNQKPKRTTQIFCNISNYLFLKLCRDIEINPSLRLNILKNHPASHHDRHETYFSKNTLVTLQLRMEYNHIYNMFLPYLIQPQTTNLYPPLPRFCTQHNCNPPMILFYTIIVPIALTPTQCEILIAQNLTQ